MTMIAADRALAAGNLTAHRRAVGATIGLGGIFLANQLLEYDSLPFRPSSDAYGSVYWMLTGLHTMHVLAGIGALGLLAIRSGRARHHRDLHAWNGTISAFWHVVDVVWVAVFLTIWIIR